MARARLLATAIAEDPDLGKLSIEAELLYLHAIPHLDRDGLVTGNPILLWAKTAPQRISLMEKAGQHIEEWVSTGLVIRYKGPDGPVLFFKGFRKHNANLSYSREEPSKFPPPPGWTRTRQGIVPDDEETCFRLLIAFDARSSYRKELESRVSRELLANLSSVGRREDQDQTEVKDQTEVNHDDDDEELSLLNLVKMLKTAGEDPDALNDLAVEWMTATHWQDAVNYLKHADGRKLHLILCWLAQLPDYADKVWGWEDSPALQSAKNPIGLIKWHVEKGTDPGLTPDHITYLAAYALWRHDVRNGNGKDRELWLYAKWDYIDRIAQESE